MAERGLEELLREAREADGTTRIAWRNSIAAYGADAVPPMRAWLEDRGLGAFATVVLEKIGSGPDAGLRRAATGALRSGRATADPGIVHLVDASLARLGWVTRTPRAAVSALPSLPAGMHVAPPYDQAHHVVTAHVESTTTKWADVYLFECGRWFSGGWVRQHGGLLEAGNQMICEQCRSGLGRSRSGPSRVAQDPPLDAPDTLYVLGNIWHIVEGAGDGGDRLGDVYLTWCSRWYEVGEHDTARGSIGGGEQLCLSCESYSQNQGKAVDMNE
jgi:hypothetical protein